MRYLRFFLMMVAAGLAACNERPSTREGTSGLYIQGNARVVSVDQTLGQAVLDYGGERINAYWQTEAYLAGSGSIVQMDPLKPPVGNYNQPAVAPQRLEAEVGDQIYFTGMKTGRNEVLLRSVGVVGK